MLDPRLRRDMNFNDYLEILGLKGGSSHGTDSQSYSWGDKRDLVPMYDGRKMTARTCLHQLQTYFTLSSNMLEEDAIHLVSLHFEGDALKWYQHGVIS